MEETAQKLEILENTFFRIKEELIPALKLEKANFTAEVDKALKDCEELTDKLYIGCLLNLAKKFREYLFDDDFEKRDEFTAFLNVSSIYVTNILDLLKLNDAASQLKECDMYFISASKIQNIIPEKSPLLFWKKMLKIKTK